MPGPVLSPKEFFKIRFSYRQLIFVSIRIVVKPLFLELSFKENELLFVMIPNNSSSFKEKALYLVLQLV